MKLLIIISSILITTLLIVGCEKSPKSLAKEAFKIKLSERTNSTIDSIKIDTVELVNTSLNSKRYYATGTGKIIWVANRNINGGKDGIQVREGDKVRLVIQMGLTFYYGANGHIETDTWSSREHLEPI